MHCDKITARILLVFSVVNVARAAPAVVRQGHTDPDVTGAASEKRYDSDDESKLASPAFSTSFTGSHSTISDDPHSGSVVSTPGTPDALARWVALMGLPEPEPEPEPGSEPGSSHHSTPPQSPPSLPHPDELAAPATNPETDTFFNEALKQKVKIYGGVGAVLGVSGGLLYGLHKLISPQSKPVGRDLASSDVVGHYACTLFHDRPRKPLVSRGLANLRDEDLQLLSVSTMAHRALESLV